MGQALPRVTRMGRCHYCPAHALLAALWRPVAGQPTLRRHEALCRLSGYARLMLHLETRTGRLVRLRTRSCRLCEEHPHATRLYGPLLPVAVLYVRDGQALRTQAGRLAIQSAGRVYPSGLQSRVLRQQEEDIRYGKPMLAGPAPLPEVGSRG